MTKWHNHSLVNTSSSVKAWCLFDCLDLLSKCPGQCIVQIHRKRSRDAWRTYFFIDQDTWYPYRISSFRFFILCPVLYDVSRNRHDCAFYYFYTITNGKNCNLSSQQHNISIQMTTCCSVYISLIKSLRTQTKTILKFYQKSSNNLRSFQEIVLEVFR